MYFLVFFLYFCCMVTAIKNPKHKVEIPDFETLSKSKSWDPKLYQPLIYNEEIKRKAETLLPGTLEYDDFWDEMDYYCYNGYKPKGMPAISGRHFFYLNFCQILRLLPGSKRKTMGAPFYRDLDHWIFLEIENAIKNGYGLIITKPRRIGMSEIGVVNCVYEMTFYQYNKIGVCAGKEDKAAEFYQKFKDSLQNIHVSYRNKIGINNSDEVQVYYENTENKQKKKYGIQSLAYMKTMFADSSAFEGGSYSLVIFEEAGLFENLIKSYMATKPCFMEGNIQFGLPLIFGTGAEIDGNSKGFKEMATNPHAYNLKKVFVPAYIYYPGDGEEDKKTGKKISFFDYKKGVTNRKAALKYILEQREIAKQSKDAYIKHVQSYPINENEVFLSDKGGVLDKILLNYQLEQINGGNSPSPVLRGRLDWVDSDETKRLLLRAHNLKEKTKIRVKNKSTVKFVEDENGTIWKDSNPINPNIQHLSYKPDIGGCDSYDDEGDEKNQLSSGCVIAYRCFSGPGREFNKPVGVLLERGDGSYEDDTFYENSVKFCLYWDMEMLVEHTKTHIIRYFKDVGMRSYLKNKPDIQEGNIANHRNEIGVKMPKEVKVIVTKLLKLEVKENIGKYWFENIILDLLDYGFKNTDISMALGIALLHRMDIFEEVTEGIEISSISKNEFYPERGSYYQDLDGTLKMQGGDFEFEIQEFDHERDLSESEYERYLEEYRKSMTPEVKKVKQTTDLDDAILNLILSEQGRLN